MKCLQLALGLALVCGLQAIVIPQTMENLDLQKVAGMWHSMAMAASDISLLDSEAAPLRVYVQELRPTPENNLEIILRRREDNRCVEKKVFAEKTECAAKFNINDLEEDEVFVLDTDYNNYLFFCVDRTGAAEPRLTCQYLARTLKVDNEVVQKFDRALKTLPVRIRLFFNPTRVEGPREDIAPSLPHQTNQEGPSPPGAPGPAPPQAAGSSGALV